MRFFLDANILFSAAYRKDSPATLLFHLARVNYCELITSAFALDEARRNIGLKRRERRQDLEELVDALRFSAIPDSVALAVASKHGLPEKDVPILAAALMAEADALVTGDRRHFGLLYDRRIGGLQIMSLAAALQSVVA
jgi:predicted nucleic acid-binding protein